VASNYLCSLLPSDSLHCAVKSSSEFHLPADPATPIVLFAAGTGLAPFRGFIAERALQKAGGREVGRTVLFYGSRDRGDILHDEELFQWVRAEALDFRPVLSRSTSADDLPEPTKLVSGTKYVQDRVWEEREDVRELFRSGAMFYTCGSGARMAADLKKVLANIIKETRGCDDDEAQLILYKLAKDRYRTDVFL
jgi:cytochrome P450/NADPH-cytochrome P450 reductase